ncbi:MAG TPA: RNA polymerase sigma factor [Stellaceae bacterium]|jgi:RNA polymerase sigma-70 factor (ECF subfamily)|nr:RNA polymerase sigma factor [Stellaceae bacterium]
MSSENDTAARAAFDHLLGALRPKLHRYCARMTGSVIDGEDAVQEALVKAIEAFPSFASIDNPEAWLFRIAHNATLDLVRRRARQEARQSEKELDMIVDPVSTVEDRLNAAVSLRTFMHLPAAQRSSVILMDVLGYSLDEIVDVTGTSLPSVKAALHRGRTRLKELAQEPEDRPLPTLSPEDCARLTGYIDHFNAREFDILRSMLAEEVKCDLVNRRRIHGRSEVSNYFTNYDRATHWHFVPGFVEGKPAILVYNPADLAGPPTYFVLIEWQADRLIMIRDFLYAPYVMEGAEVQPLA